MLAYDFRGAESQPQMSEQEFLPTDIHADGHALKTLPVLMA